MANRRILIDTSILIDFFRKENKKNSILFNLQQKFDIGISSVSEFEFLAGIKDEHFIVIKNLFDNMSIYPFDSKASHIASVIYKQLRSQNKLIEFRDIFIGATALSNKLPIATLNIKHFKRIENLEILEL